MKILQRIEKDTNLKTTLSKKLILTSLGSLLFSTFIFAQTTSGFGIKGGLNYNGNGDYFESISNSYQNPEENIGYHVGIFGKLGNKVYFRPELIYTSTTSDYDAGTFDFKKLDAPLLVGVKILGPISVFGGPSLQYVLDSDFENATVNNIENDFTVGLNFGIGFSINKVGLDLRYERGFNNNEATIINNNMTINNPNRLDTRPEQLILSLSIML
ncbi:outer membrane beta-barrel protein [Olleya aquimaris]|uniref:Outer membrane protein with beta-barrel domain n=1 Tax=Olleya aquimaris TaxID=639310 RepID=A0A327R9T9_9FLAO|nr:outer membrane beta-barrel protein [Olleya aquimaris]RAJ12928.1 outer membrane protein with beta-barrel domain [Olleya aquimaris]